MGFDLVVKLLNTDPLFLFTHLRFLNNLLRLLLDFYALRGLNLIGTARDGAKLIVVTKMKVVVVQRW